MKKLNASFNKGFATFILLFFNAIVYAQIDIDIDLGKQEWYEDPKVWIGVAVFLKDSH